MDFGNTTQLDTERLEALLLHHTAPFRHDRLTVRVRYSRGADFSGTCYYGEGRIFVNLGRHVVYPYRLGTHIARSQSNSTHWWRETYGVIIPDAYRLVLFVYLHELYHYLVKMARRNPRRKEAMCDRFATRILVDHHDCAVLDWRRQPVQRELWDFQDLDAFVALAPKSDGVHAPGARGPRAAASKAPRPREIPVTIRGARAATGRRKR